MPVQISRKVTFTESLLDLASARSPDIQNGIVNMDILGGYPPGNESLSYPDRGTMVSSSSVYICGKLRWKLKITLVGQGRTSSKPPFVGSLLAFWGCMYVCMYVNIYIYMQIYIYMCIYIYMYAYIYIYVLSMVITCIYMYTMTPVFKADGFTEIIHPTSSNWPVILWRWTIQSERQQWLWEAAPGMGFQPAMLLYQSVLV